MCVRVSAQTQDWVYETEKRAKQCLAILTSHQNLFAPLVRVEQDHLIFRTSVRARVYPLQKKHAMRKRAWIKYDINCD